MAAEDNPNRPNGSTTLDAGDMTELIRGSVGGDVEERDDRSEGREPEVRVVEEDEVVRRTSPRGEAATETEDDSVESRLTKALNTIESMQTEMRDLRSQRPVDRDTTREPEIKLKEFAPGIRLPEDPSLWPVKLTKEVLSSLGIDPEIAPGMNVLANGLVSIITHMVSEGVSQNANREIDQRESRNARQRAFYNAFPDLVGAEDIVANSESLLRQRGFGVNNRVNEVEYGTRIAQESRSRIARLRGMTLNQYLDDFESGRSRGRRNAGNNGGTINPRYEPVNRLQPNRARVARGGGRVSREGYNPNDNERELDDTLRS